MSSVIVIVIGVTHDMSSVSSVNSHLVIGALENSHAGIDKLSIRKLLL